MPVNTRSNKSTSSNPRITEYMRQTKRIDTNDFTFDINPKVNPKNKAFNKVVDTTKAALVSDEDA